MRIRIVKPGPFSTIQDMGRYGYSLQGVPVAGVMDRLSASIANIAVGNSLNCAVIELTYGGAVLFAETDMLIAYSGQGAALQVNSRLLPKNKPVYISAGSLVEQEGAGEGSRIYVAIAGGWDVPMILGSRSTYLAAQFGGLEGRLLAANDVLISAAEMSDASRNILAELEGPDVNYPHWQIQTKNVLSNHSFITIRVVPGPECNMFTGESIVNFFSQPYLVEMNSNRMGINFTGANITRHNKTEILSTAVVPGTIQVTNSGKAVLLMADCQTTGGYPRIAQVAAVDIPVCGQLKPGNEVYFEQITWPEAETLYIEQQEYLRKATLSLKHKYWVD